MGDIEVVGRARLSRGRMVNLRGRERRADLLPEAWIAPPPVRQLRALLRHRAQLVRLRTLLRNRIHAILADHGHDRPAGCKLFIVSPPSIVINTDGLTLTYSKLKLHSKNAAADPRLHIELAGSLLHAKVIEQRPQKKKSD